MLPVAELEAECSARGIGLAEVPSEVSADVEALRNHLRLLLSLELCAPSYEMNDVPVRKLGLHQAASVIGELKQIEALPVKDLLVAYVEYGFMPATAATTPEVAELRRRVQDITVWHRLTVAQLWSECKEHDIELKGFSLGAGLQEDDIRRLLIDRLLLRTCVQRAATFIVSSDTAHEDNHGKLSDTRPSVHRYVEVMRDAIVAHRICGVTKERMPVLQSLPDAAESWTDMEVAAYCVSGGVFNPELHRRSPVSKERARTLISVTCPTTDKRLHFHEMLYECFQQQ
eukprot:5935571-Amphidinium_carterae.1